MTTSSYRPPTDIIANVVDEVLNDIDKPLPAEHLALHAWMDGLTTAAVIGPVTVTPDEIMAALPTDVQNAAPAMVRAMAAIIGVRCEQINDGIRAEKDDFEPDFMARGQSDAHELELAREWAAGFYRGLHFRPGSWRKLVDDEDSRVDLVPILLLVQPNVKPGASGNNDEECQKMLPYIGEAVWGMRQFWRQHASRKAPAGRPLAKLGRNSACPCGSGQKFKRCCMN